MSADNIVAQLRTLSAKTNWDKELGHKEYFTISSDNQRIWCCTSHYIANFLKDPYR